jgi:alpha-glucosidase
MITNTELEQKGNQFPADIISYKKKVDTLYFQTSNGVTLQVTVVRDSVLRFRYTTTSNFDEDFSYAITKYASTGYNHLEITEVDNAYVITTQKLICTVNKVDLKIALFDVNDNTLISQDELGFHWEESFEYGTDIVKMSKVSHDGESYFGLGDKPGSLNLKGKRYENWVTDSYAYGRDLFILVCITEKLMEYFSTIHFEHFLILHTRERM